jgi:ankyrin repeat protein
MIFVAVALVSVFAGQAASQPPANRPSTRQSGRAGTALIEAAKLGDANSVQTLVNGGATVDTTDWRGYTPLFWAAASGRLDIVTTLLNRGASAARKATDGTTALMLAAAGGHLDVVKSLVARGAPLGATKNGVTAQQLAARRGFPEVAALLEQAEAAGQRLLQATRDGNDGATRQLITLGAPVNTTDARGTTPLMMAARTGNLGILQFLLARGADTTAADQDGRTVWDWAELSRDTGTYVVSFLTDRGLSRTAATAVPRSNEPPPPPVAQSLRALSAALSRINPASGAVRSAKQRADRALTQLITLSARWPAESPEDYRMNLAASVRAVDGLAGTDAAATAATLVAIAEDLEAKLEHCTRSGGALGGSVTVRVRTIQSGSEIKRWQVFYLPKIFETVAGADPDLFPQLSSPTEEALVPGRYLMWVRDPATSRLGERTVVKVGEGRRELLIELPVPSDASR